MKALGVLGTSSSVGKSWMTTALCAWLHGQGVRVAPFKAQNMSNNAWPTLEGGEISRAQAVQAEACGLRAIMEMNPILLKPSGGAGVQLVLRGQAQGHVAARDYFTNTERLWSVVAECLDYWHAHCDVLVLEGAGSPVELNLMARDLVNLRPLRHLDARWLLVGDIDRGGIYAQLAGTWALLPPGDRARCIGAIVNRFR
ncbi:MAG: AAA family ATPase, partial [Verrucomicrobia bacterium]|nr:AAA family ATPase [Verrucomicrobiota bacterium]